MGRAHNHAVERQSRREAGVKRIKSSAQPFQPMPLCSLRGISALMADRGVAHGSTTATISASGWRC